jgi:outer membrane protein TolC
LARADADLTLAKRSSIPDVSVFGFLSRFDGGGNTETSGGGSLGINLPIFQENGPSVADAVSERQRAGAELDDLVRAAQAELATAYRRCQETADELRLVADEIVPRARQNLELQHRRAEREEVSAYDVVDYDLELISAQSDLLEARHAYTDALIDLEKAAQVPLMGIADDSAATAQPAGADQQGDAEH